VCGLLTPVKPRQVQELIDIEELADLSTVEHARSTVDIARSWRASSRWRNAFWVYSVPEAGTGDARHAPRDNFRPESHCAHKWVQSVPEASQPRGGVG